MKLIIEEIDNFECLSESTGGSKHLFIAGPFLVGNTRNRNNRYYPMTILEGKAQTYIENYVKQDRAFGELGHPKGPIINLEIVSHRITELVRDGNVFNGKARIIEEGLGKIAYGIIDSGGKMGVSSRAVGTLKQNAQGIQEVQSDLIIATAADLVVNPSAPGAFVNGIYEEAEYFMEGDKLVERAGYLAREKLMKLHSNQLKQEVFVRLFEEYLDDIVHEK